MEDYKVTRAKLVARKKVRFCMSTTKIDEDKNVLKEKSGIQLQMERLKQLKEKQSNEEKI